MATDPKDEATCPHCGKPLPTDPIEQARLMAAKGLRERMRDLPAWEVNEDWSRPKSAG